MYAAGQSAVDYPTCQTITDKGRPAQSDPSYNCQTQLQLKSVHARILPTDNFTSSLCCNGMKLSGVFVCKGLAYCTF